MLDRWRQPAGDLLGRLDDDEEGAIFLAALAAVMILIMVALVIYDAGKSAGDKIDLQNAADTAAYSQASVRARSMNMLAFSNVAKREVVSLHSMYFGMFSGFAIWTAQRCREAKSFSDDARNDCLDNSPLISGPGGEGLEEWRQFTGNRLDASDSPHLTTTTIIGQMINTVGGNNLSQRAFGREVMALDDYQRYLVRITPVWAWTQALIRGTRNGAHAVSTFPTPGFTGSVADGWVRNAGVGFNNDAVGIEDFEVSCGERTNNRDHLLNRVRPPDFSADGLQNMHHQSCLPFNFGSTQGFSGLPVGNPNDARSALTQPLLQSLGNNLQLHSNKSNVAADTVDPVTLGLIYAIDASPPAVFPSPAGGGCWWSTFLFSSPVQTAGSGLTNDECEDVNNLPRLYSVPYSLGANDESADALMARSNIVFSYKNTPDRALEINGGRVEGSGDESTYRNLLDAAGYQVADPNNPLFSSSGYWSMARAEIVYPHLEAGTDPENNPPSRPASSGGARGIWLFRPGWTAKLRPMALPNEWASLDYNLQAAFHATDPQFRVAQQMGLFSNTQDDAPSGLGDVLEDVEFMDQAMRTLNDNDIAGTPK